MRRIDRDAHVLVPKFGVPTLAEEVRDLGFGEVMELPHAQVVQLAPGVRVASYQNGARRLGVRGRRRRARAGRHQRRQDPRSDAAQDPGGVRAPDVRVQELLVRAGLPGAVHRRRSRRPRAGHPRHLPRRLGAGGRRSSARITACRSAAWSRSCIPRLGTATSTSSRRARSSTCSASSSRIRPPRRCRWTRATAGARKPASSSRASTGTRTARSTSTSSPRR